MNGVIVKKGVEAYTYLKKIFLSLDNIQLDYNWLISAHECNPENANFEILLSNENCWISGKELTEMIFCEDFQWIWCILTGFKKGISKEQVFSYKLPNEKTYNDYFINPIKMSHPLADIEIISIDSTSTLFISNQDDLIHKFERNFIYSQDLFEYNNIKTTS